MGLSYQLRTKFWVQTMSGSSFGAVSCKPFSSPVFLVKCVPLEILFLGTGIWGCSQVYVPGRRQLSSSLGQLCVWCARWVRL